MKKTIKKGRRKNVEQLLLLIAVIIFVNVIGSIQFFRVDLTSDNRHSLKESTIALLVNEEKVKEPILVKVYLNGNLPAHFEKLKRATREKLEEFKVYGGANFNFIFINPFQEDDEETNQKITRQLIQQGLRPFKVQNKLKDKISEQILFPGALVAMGDGRDIPISLLHKSQGNAISPERIHQSTLNLEYAFTAAIRKAINKSNPKEITFLQGHGELSKDKTFSIQSSLSEFYKVTYKSLNNNLHALDSTAVLVIAKPRQPFTSKDKFLIDQYIMKGGKVAWMVDRVNPYRDTLNRKLQSLALTQDLEISGQLFHYGVRINPNLIVSKNFAYEYSPMHQSPIPWNYYPLIYSDNSHPIVGNINPVKFEYASTLDTVGEDSNKKTILLGVATNQSIIENPPTRIDFLKSEEFNDGTTFSPTANENLRALAILVEGEFESFYKGRIHPKILADGSFPFKENSVPTKMLIVGDGDLLKNETKRVPYGDRFRIDHLPLDKNKFEKLGIPTRYGNADFFLNAIDYLLGDQSLITSRSKLTVRKLNIAKVEKERIFWQVNNIVAPVVLILLFGICMFFIRKYRYGR